MKNKWFANGKLLITGEYLVLYGAEALAVPLKLGQNLQVQQTKDGLLSWQANKPGEKWFEAVFTLPELNIIETSDREMSEQLKSLLQNAVNQNGHFLKNETGLKVITHLDFDPSYGFGSSSTLVYCVAQWAGVDPYILQRDTFGGSGYDIACAGANSPIIYKRNKENMVVININFSPPFRKQLYFVYLGRKKHTRSSIKNFREEAVYSESDVERVTAITHKIYKADKLEEFEALLTEHEEIMAGILHQPTVKNLYFKNYEGTVKSLGAWGGDFILATSRLTPEEFTRQMNTRGFQIIYPFTELVL